MSLLQLPPLSLYIHIPWCVRKCPYCDFNSHQREDELPEAAYVARLLKDLQADLPYVQGRELQSIFIGGGTPSLFSAAAYAQLLHAAEALIAFAPNIEITLEANPGTAELEKFSGYRAAGINRLSIGVQSFNAEHLKVLGRIHDSSEALRAADFARSAGFNNFNLDLMFGLPGQTTDQACTDINTAIACSPTHISWYQLTIEPNTEFYSKPPQTPVDDALADMQDAGLQVLAANGYKRYEVSAYAQNDLASAHNLNYWQFGDYLGIGAGAHGKITLPESGNILRTRKTRMPRHYLDNNRILTAETRTVSQQELPLEFMMNALRLSEGCPATMFEPRTGLALATLDGKLQLLQKRGLLCKTEQRIQPTDRGLLHLNELLLQFM